MVDPIRPTRPTQRPGEPDPNKMLMQEFKTDLKAVHEKFQGVMTSPHLADSQQVLRELSEALIKLHESSAKAAQLKG